MKTQEDSGARGEGLCRPSGLSGASAGHRQFHVALPARRDLSERGSGEGRPDRHCFVRARSQRNQPGQLIGHFGPQTLDSSSNPSYSTIGV